MKESSQNPNSKEDQHMIVNLKVQVKDSRRIEEILKRQLEEKEKEKERL
jgi:hypothetical protein